MDDQLICLLAQLHRKSLLLLQRHMPATSSPLQGLSTAGRVLRLRSNVKRKLRSIDFAYGLARKVSHRSIEAFLVELESEIKGECMTNKQRGVFDFTDNSDDGSSVAPRTFEPPEATEAPIVPKSAKQVSAGSGTGKGKGTQLVHCEVPPDFVHVDGDGFSADPVVWNDAPCNSSTAIYVEQHADTIPDISWEVAELVVEDTVSNVMSRDAKWADMLDHDTKDRVDLSSWSYNCHNSGICSSGFKMVLLLRRQLLLLWLHCKNERQLSHLAEFPALETSFIDLNGLRSKCVIFSPHWETSLLQSVQLMNLKV